MGKGGRIRYIEEDAEDHGVILPIVRYDSERHTVTVTEEALHRAFDQVSDRARLAGRVDVGVRQIAARLEEQMRFPVYNISIEKIDPGEMFPEVKVKEYGTPIRWDPQLDRFWADDGDAYGDIVGKRY